MGSWSGGGGGGGVGGGVLEWLGEWGGWWVGGKGVAQKKVLYGGRPLRRAGENLRNLALMRYAQLRVIGDV